MTCKNLTLKQFILENLKLSPDNTKVLAKIAE